MSTEKELKELMNLVQDIKDYGCQQDYAAFESRLRALLAELEAAREDAARWKEVAFGPSPFLGVFYVDYLGNECRLCEQEAVDVVDAARKGEA